MFELTDTLTYAVPVMLSVLVAKTVADALEPKGIYDLVIEWVSQDHDHIDSQSTFILGCRNSRIWMPNTNTFGPISRSTMSYVLSVVSE